MIEIARSRFTIFKAKPFFQKHCVAKGNSHKPKFSLSRGCGNGKMQFENLSIGELEKNPDKDKRITKACFNL